MTGRGKLTRLRELHHAHRPAHVVMVIVHQRLGDFARLVSVWADFGDGRHFGAGADDEAFLEAGKFLCLDMFFDQLFRG